MQLVRFLVQPNELEIQYEILRFLSKDKDDKHAYISKNLNRLELHLSEMYGLDCSALRKQSVFDAMELAIKQFDLSPDSDAHLSALMDMVFDVEQKQGADLQSFLSYWDKKGHLASISSPENIESVHIMTIHKSKGLEFPIVLFPFANSYIYEEIDPKLWLPVEKEGFSGFDALLINKKQEVQEYGEVASALYEIDHQKLQLDAFNLLYVVLTRAISGLFIISAYRGDKNEEDPKYYASLFIRFLKLAGHWEENKFSYEFGRFTAPTNFRSTTSLHQNIPYIYTNKDRADFKIVASTGLLWDEGLDVALHQGNIIHDILGMVYTPADLDRALQIAAQKGSIKEGDQETLKEMIKNVLFHPDLIQFYQKDVEVFNERDILLADGSVQRPDRVTLKNDLITIIDYKTGERNPKYRHQVNRYAEVYSEMGYTIAQKIIVYINDNIEVEYI